MEQEHYYTEKPTSEAREKIIKSRIRGKEFTFKTASGMFAINKVDRASILLAETAPNAKTLLDLGCGYGPVGISIAATTNAEVTMTEINQRAAALAKQNVKINKVQAEVLQGNMYEPVAERKFDAILLNPPQSAGKKTCEQMIAQAKEHLNKNGTLSIVARKKKGGESLSEKMRETFGNIQTIKIQGGFRIYRSKFQ